MTDSDIERKKKALGGVLTLTDKDIEELSESKLRVLALMKDGLWYQPDEIRRAAGVNGREASDGLRRLRELRSNFDVEKRRVSPGRTWAYRLVPRLAGGLPVATRTIVYLVDLHDKRLVETFEGRAGRRPPEGAVCAANQRVVATGHSCVLAEGVLFFQRDQEVPR